LSSNPAEADPVWLDCLDPTGQDKLVHEYVVFDESIESVSMYYGEEDGFYAFKNAEITNNYIKTSGFVIDRNTGHKVGDMEVERICHEVPAITAVPQKKF
jgi:hypothetical protein